MNSSHHGSVDVARRVFSMEYARKAEQLFLHPGTSYPWTEIVNGAMVWSPSGGCRRISAVDSNTFRGFHLVDKNGPRATAAFRDFFTERKGELLAKLNQINDAEQLHLLSNEMRDSIRVRLRNVKQMQLASYNKVRKLVDLYLMNLVAMAEELERPRPKLVPLLSVPLDSQIISCTALFSDSQLKRSRLTRRSTYKDVTSEKCYRELQGDLSTLARSVGVSLKFPFPPIYFDLMWRERYRNSGKNLFETNPV